MTVSVRPLQEHHIAPLVAAALESVHELQPWMPWCHPDFSERDAREWVELQVQNWERRDEFQFAIEDERGLYLGGCGINFINFTHRLGNVGYWVRTGATRRGVATEAVKHVIDFARTETNLIRLEILVALGNEASGRVAEKVGAKFECILRSRLLLHGSARDARMYSVVLNR